jgi:hypothetical protein
LATKPEIEQNVRRLPHPNIGWIGLYDPDWVAWLEHNQQNIFTPECDRLPAEEAVKCVKRVIEEKHLEKRCELPVYESPDSASQKLGTIIMFARENLYAEYRAEGENKSVEFWPDESANRDWGYGVQFHQTYLDKKGTWYKLPAKPLPKPGWVDMSLVTKTPDDRKDIDGNFLDSGWPVIVLGIAADGTGLCIRSEERWDFSCGDRFSDEEITLDRVQVIPWKDLLDKDGHLTLHIAHPRGC